MLMLILLIAYALAHPSYLALERYEEFPKFVDAKSFQLPDSDKRSEIMLRKRISTAIFDNLHEMRLEGVMSNNAPSRMQNYHTLETGITIIGNNYPIFEYNTLKKIHAELLDRNITFICRVNDQYGGYGGASIAFEKIIPKRSEVFEIILKRV